jgi:hypothetical protein
VCSTEARVVVRGGLWGLVFFTWMIEIATAVLWRRLYKLVLNCDAFGSNSQAAPFAYSPGEPVCVCV